MNLSRSSIFALTLILSTAVLWAYIEYKAMNSKFNQDMGNGIIIYGDHYIDSGDWLFNCELGSLVSRIPLPVPADQLKNTSSFETETTIHVREKQKNTAKLVIQYITKKPEWYMGLHYRNSILSESSKLLFHTFQLITDYEGEAWEIYLFQDLAPRSHSQFSIGAKPHDPATFIDHEKAIQQARASCPTPQ
ncbi:hypothetical protein [Pseudomonas sp. PI1]|uniref:hypothetical protein n=1 Tax=Pseudomonas sp. PI1 TaxID=1582493 RepID=UPI001269FB38|nr:hypothetical protein [Pseudomonas sp. PI1]